MRSANPGEAQTIGHCLPSIPSDAPPPNAQRETPESESLITRRTIDELWRRMTSIYGHRWVTNYGDADHDDTWLRALRDLTPQELGRGLSACVRAEPGDWPPTLPQFRVMCRPTLMPYHEPFLFPKCIPAPVEIAAEHIAKCRALLRGSKP